MGGIISEFLFFYRDRKRRRRNSRSRLTWHKAKPYVELWLTVIFVLVVITAVINIIIFSNNNG